MEKEINISYIYALVDPETDEIRYVGKTKDMDKRLYLHIGGYSNQRYVTQWIDSLKVNGRIPIIKELEQCPDYFGTYREAYWVKKMLCDGNDLLNINITVKTDFDGVNVQLPKYYAGLLAQYKRTTGNGLVDILKDFFGDKKNREHDDCMCFYYDHDGDGIRDIKVTEYYHNLCCNRPSKSTEKRLKKLSS